MRPCGQKATVSDSPQAGTARIHGFSPHEAREHLLLSADGVLALAPAVQT